MGNFFVSSEAT